MFFEKKVQGGSLYEALAFIDPTRIGDLEQLDFSKIPRFEAPVKIEFQASLKEIFGQNLIDLSEITTLPDDCLLVEKKDESIEIWNPVTKQPENKLPVHVLLKVIPLSDAHLLLVQKKDKSIGIWDSITRECKARFPNIVVDTLIENSSFRFVKEHNLLLIIAGRKGLYRIELFGNFNVTALIELEKLAQSIKFVSDHQVEIHTFTYHPGQAVDEVEGCTDNWATWRISDDYHSIELENQSTRYGRADGRVDMYGDVERRTAEKAHKRSLNYIGTRPNGQIVTASISTNVIEIWDVANEKFPIKSCQIPVEKNVLSGIPKEIKTYFDQLPQALQEIIKQYSIEKDATLSSCIVNILTDLSQSNDLRQARELGLGLYGSNQSFDNLKKILNIAHSNPNLKITEPLEISDRLANFFYDDEKDQVIVASERKVRIWDLESLSCIKVLKGPFADSKNESTGCMYYRWIRRNNILVGSLRSDDKFQYLFWNLYNNTHQFIKESEVLWYNKELVFPTDKLTFHRYDSPSRPLVFKEIQPILVWLKDNIAANSVNFLNLSGISLGKEGVKLLCELLETDKKINHVILQKTALNDETARKLLEILPNCPDLKFDLSNNESISENTLKEFGTHLLDKNPPAPPSLFFAADNPAKKGSKGNDEKNVSQIGKNRKSCTIQ